MLVPTSDIMCASLCVNLLNSNIFFQSLISRLGALKLFVAVSDSKCLDCQQKPKFTAYVNEPSPSPPIFEKWISRSPQQATEIFINPDILIGMTNDHTQPTDLL
ncbi:hypothetical protein TcWFU_010010 [Taenia crassiceps]|uniref:Uncharacterized protein n=1 Tax=Taenia crassiceps TaxID=6207 RepID=A0ABR4QKE4_9CEST